MMLPHIRTIYRKTAEHITAKKDKAYCLHMHTIRRISERARQEGWTSHQRIGAIAQDSANINSGIEHDYVSNMLNGGDESHRVASLSGMCCALAQKMKDTRCGEEMSRLLAGKFSSEADCPSQNACLVFKMEGIV